MAEPNETDKWGVLMRSAIAGDARAYSALLEDLARALRITIRGALNRAGQGNKDIEDIVQETLLAVHLKRHTWDSERPFSPWINAIARYKIIDSFRRQGQCFHLQIDDLAETLPTPAAAASDQGDVERLVQRLDPRQQRIVRAISIEGHSATDVAQAEGMNENAVRVALHRALKHLASLYRSDVQ